MNKSKNIRQTFILIVIMMAMMPLCTFSQKSVYPTNYTQLKAVIESADPYSQLKIYLTSSNFTDNYTDLEEGNRTINIYKGKNIELKTQGVSFTRESEEYLFHISEGSMLTIYDYGKFDNNKAVISCHKFAEVIDGSTLELHNLLLNCTGPDFIVAKKVNGESGGTINIFSPNPTGQYSSTIKYDNTFCNLNDGSTLNILDICKFEAQNTNDQPFSLITTDDNNLSRVHIVCRLKIDCTDDDNLTEDDLIEFMNNKKSFSIVRDMNINLWPCYPMPHTFVSKGKKPTCTEEGIEDHYLCTTCNWCFEDEEATKEFYHYQVAKTLPPIPHNYDDMTDRCTKCGELMESKDIVDGEACEHKYRQDYETFKKFTYRRTFTEKQVGKWQALYIPFKLEYNDWKDGYDVAAINNFHEYFDENGNVVKRELEVCLINNGKLLANIPYLIRPKAAGEMVLEKENADVYGAYEIGLNCQSTNRYYSFTGTYHSINGLKEKEYIFLSDGILCKAKNDEVTLKPQRWYLTIEDMFPLWETDNTEGSDDSAVMSMPIRVIGENEASGIEEIKFTKTVLGSDGKPSSAIYNINGCRMESMKSGVNIVRMADGRVIKMTVK